MGLDGDTTYYWRIDTKNDFGMTQGEVWKFHYKPDTPSLINNLQTDINAIVIYPNPTNDIFNVDYFLEKECFFSLKLTDLQGKLLALLKNEYQTPGKYSYPIDIRNNSIKLQPGLYILKFEIGNKIYSKRLLVK
jgi:hypothetical protein